MYIMIHKTEGWPHEIENMHSKTEKEMFYFGSKDEWHKIDVVQLTS